MPHVYTLDLHYLGRPQVIASYLLESNDGLIMIETGPGSTLTAAQAALHAHGFHPRDVRHILLTHIHLDHAGAAGWWANQGAQIYVHHFGQRHLVDPSKLMASATRIYGDLMGFLWGEMLPVPASQLHVLHDGDLLALGGVEIAAWETQGHALHHMSYVVEDVAFTGDVAGTRVPGYPVADAPTPPPEFEWEVWLKALDRLQEAQFRAIYPTHFGQVDDVDGQLNGVREMLNQIVPFVRERMGQGHTAEEITAEYAQWYRNRALGMGIPPEAFDTLALSNSPAMTINGIWRYWQKRDRDRG